MGPCLPILLLTKLTMTKICKDTFLRHTTQIKLYSRCLLLDRIKVRAVKHSGDPEQTSAITRTKLTTEIAKCEQGNLKISPRILRKVSAVQYVKCSHFQDYAKLQIMTCLRNRCTIVTIGQCKAWPFIFHMMFLFPSFYLCLYLSNHLSLPSWKHYVLRSWSVDSGHGGSGDVIKIPPIEKKMEEPIFSQRGKKPGNFFIYLFLIYRPTDCRKRLR